MESYKSLHLIFGVVGFGNNSARVISQSYYSVYSRAVSSANKFDDYRLTNDSRNLVSLELCRGCERVGNSTFRCKFDGLLWRVDKFRALWQSVERNTIRGAYLGGVVKVL